VTAMFINNDTGYKTVSSSSTI